MKVGDIVESRHPAVWMKNNLKSRGVAMKVGDLCKFVGTTGWGTLCIVVEVDVWDEWSAGQIRVFSDNGKVGCLAAMFLEVIK